MAKKRGRKRKQDAENGEAEHERDAHQQQQPDENKPRIHAAPSVPDFSQQLFNEIAVPNGPLTGALHTIEQPSHHASSSAGPTSTSSSSNLFSMPTISQPATSVQLPSNQMIGPSAVQFTSPPLASPASTSNSLTQVSGEVPTDPTGAATSIFEGFTSKGHSLAEGLELVSAAAGHVSSLEQAMANSFQDPIACGVVTDAEADQLVGYYFAHLQDCICLLDPYLHTSSYMRQHSVILLTAVLAVSAKFMREKALYERLLDMADSAIKTAIFQPLYDIQVIQAICILVCKSKHTQTCVRRKSDCVHQAVVREDYMLSHPSCAFRLERCHGRLGLATFR